MIKAETATKTDIVDKELEAKCRKFSENVSENLHTVSHDPSLALYRIQEHVRRSTPQMIEKKFDVIKLQQGIQGACFDIENAIDVVKSMTSSIGTFQSIYDSLRSTMYYKQQLDYERMRRNERGRKITHSSSKDSIVQELRKTKSMGHIGSASDLMSESVASRSTASTPCSEYPDVISVADMDDFDIEHALKTRRDTLTLMPDDDKSSTTTSGADSHVSDQDATFDEEFNGEMSTTMDEDAQKRVDAICTEETKEKEIKK